MMNYIKFLILIVLSACIKVTGQSQVLTLKQQIEDFTIFRNSLQEGHSGLYYFINESSFIHQCDSIQMSFNEGASIESYYLKLRYLITLLNHGHTRISLPANSPVNYKMAVLERSKLYLPFEFVIINKQLVIKADCSKEKLFREYSVVKKINNIPTAELLSQMIPLMPADGKNLTFKYYSLFNYYYFHFLFNLLYPSKKGVSIELKDDNTHYYIELLKPEIIDSIYFARYKKNISHYETQLKYEPDLKNQTAYLKIGSFYKGLITQFGQNYEIYLDSVFTDIKSKKLQHLILDLRDNEGGGDGYDNLLLSYLIDIPAEQPKVFVPGRKFAYTNYLTSISDDLKAFIENPDQFLVNDTSLILKDIYSGQINYPVSVHQFDGNMIVLTNGGSFSATSNVIGALYKYRKNNKRKIVFVGEENGGDIYCGTICAGQGYSIRLPNSLIVIDMPLLCFGALNKQYPKTKIPDFEVYDNISYLKQGKDNVLLFAKKKCIETVKSKHL